jgi:hypothetical protein
MIRSMSVIVVICVAAGCGGSTEPASEGTPPGTVVTVPSPEAFAGTWRSVTPSTEFVRLLVQPKSSEIDVLAARLTFSGIAWEGAGRIDGDSLVLNMTVGASTPGSSVIVARKADAQTLSFRMKSGAAPPLDLTFVREN